MPVMKGRSIGKPKLPRYEITCVVQNVKLYPDLPEGQEASEDPEKNKYKKCRIEAADLPRISVPDKDDPSKTVEILDGFNVWFDPVAEWAKLNPRLKELYRIVEKGEHPRVKITYYVSTKTDPLDPKKIIARKRLAVKDLDKLRIMTAADK